MLIPACGILVQSKSAVILSVNYIIT